MKQMHLSLFPISFFLLISFLVKSQDLKLVSVHSPELDEYIQLLEQEE